jgi:hypothetical protein
MCEAKAITGNLRFLLAFAHILKFVYETLDEENNRSKEAEGNI